MEGTFAPTKAIWSLDIRTAGYRVCAADSKNVRVECRVGGADLNPYLALAAQIAAGLDGIEMKQHWSLLFPGCIHAKEARDIPKTLRDATSA